MSNVHAQKSPHFAQLVRERLCRAMIAGNFRLNVCDMATVMLDAVRKFSEKYQTSDLALIQIVIFDSSMCDGFARALHSAVQHSQSLFGRAKRKLHRYPSSSVRYSVFQQVWN